LPTAEQIIEMLNLKPLPREGGYFTQTYCSENTLPIGVLSHSYLSDKHLSTAIYYLLTPETQSMLHRLPTDEIYHFYLGDPVRMLQLYPDGRVRTMILGQDLAAGQHPQLTVPREVWQGSFLNEGGKFALMGTTMAPGFDNTDYEGGDRKLLIEKYPGYAELITRLTPDHQIQG